MRRITLSCIVILSLLCTQVAFSAENIRRVNSQHINYLPLRARDDSITQDSDTSQPTTESFFNSVYSGGVRPLPNSYFLTNQWGDYRRTLSDLGITMNLSYTNNLLGNPIGGLRQGFAYTDSSGLNLTLDLNKILALKGWLFLVSFVQRNGESLSAKYIGNLFPVSQIFGGENFRMDIMYLKKNMLNDKLQISIGRLNAGDYFLQSQLYYAYVSNAFDGNPIGVFFNVPFSAYPNAQWGAYLHVRPGNIIAGKLAVFNTNRSNSENRFHGFNFTFHGDNGAMLITEWDLLNNKHLCLFGCRLPGRYTVGFMYFTGKDQKDFVTNKVVQGNYGFYYQLEQKVYRPGINPLRGLVLFFVMEAFPQNYNKIPIFFDGGIIYRGLVGSRPRDFISLGFAYGKFGDRYAQAQQLMGQPKPTFEGVLEINYRWHITNWYFFQPDIQYIIHPNGLSTIKNAWVFGGQMGLSL